MRKMILIVAAAGMVAACSGGTTTESATTTPQPTEAGETAGPPSAAAEPSETALTSEPAVAAFQPISLNGSGKKVAKFTIPDEPAIAEITHKGEDNFIVDTLDASGERLDNIVNVIGNYSGTVLFDLGKDDHSAAFQIDADGQWTITIKPYTAAPIWDPATTLKGVGDNVYRLVPVSEGLTTLDMTYKGNDNFIVDVISGYGLDLLANEIGDFSGQARLPSGTVLVSIDADEGVWTLKPG